uniref:NADH-ubiquinone oxidoreductase chain 1 n=1 Tax=Parajapyx emeryanus TaxID=165473 RepID=U3KTL9_9HEXA|nr:NADH dehydrogenase subunit 1 [Parajapyx emeryanus]AEV44859.1 NADH dehydrogenase subunit 1 [Parajapyx emeryanus]
MLTFISYLLIVVCVLVSVAFFTLLERKVLGYIQIRKGPNKVGYVGLPQPFADAIKLFTKECSSPSMTNYYPYYFCPIFAIFISLITWLVFPFSSYSLEFNLGLVFFLCCSSLSVYTVLGAGWASNSKYALLGGLRAVAQTISYEVSLALILLSFIFLVEGYGLYLFCENQSLLWFFWVVAPLGLAWFASCLAETNRTPFDFAEGESELVSGFNIEYGGGGFALIFMAEYAMIIFMGFIFAVLFLGADVYSLMFYFKMILISYFFLWVRGTLPRFRYDKLMYLAWKMYLPMALNYLFFFMGLSVLIWALLL